jgi:hypothetical protein
MLPLLQKDGNVFLGPFFLAFLAFEGRAYQFNNPTRELQDYALGIST